MWKELLRELDRRLKYGPGIRVQRLVEASFFIAAFFSGDVRFAYVPFGLSALHALSTRGAPIAVAVAAFVPAPRDHRLGDLYFDLAAARGACAISACVQAASIGLIRADHPTAGFLMLALPASSFILAPTIGFCCGSSVYVGIRDALVRLGLAKRYANGTCDVSISGTKASDHQ